MAELKDQILLPTLSLTAWVTLDNSLISIGPQRFCMLRGVYMHPQDVFSSKIPWFFLLNIKVIPQIEIYSFQLQRLSEVSFAIVQSCEELGRVIKDEAEESQEEDICMHGGNTWICYEWRHMPRGISVIGSGCLITCVADRVRQCYIVCSNWDPVALIYLAILLFHMYLLP